MEPKFIKTDEDLQKTGLDRGFVVEMYKNYLEKLKPYNAELQKPEKDFEQISKEEISSAMERDDTDLILLCTDGHPVGFAIVGQYPNAYCEDDIYIQEFFIKERKAGYGREAVKAVLEQYGDIDVSLFTLEENFPARLFWQNVMKELGYSELVKEGRVTPPPAERFAPTDTVMIFRYYSKQ